MAPTVRSFSADFEPLRLVSRYPEYYPGLLESGAAAAPSAASARYDILPISSGEILQLGPAQRLQGAHAAGAHGFFDALESWWAGLQMPAAAHELPFQGGWLIYLGYELAAEIEPTLRLAANPDWRMLEHRDDRELDVKGPPETWSLSGASPDGTEDHRPSPRARLSGHQSQPKRFAAD